MTAGQGQNPARQASIGAGLPHSVPAVLVNMLCGSGLKSVALGVQAIRSGESSVLALTAGQGQNPARQASIGAGLPHSVPAVLVNMLCGSGLKSVALGVQAIRSGESSVLVCGGQESMSQAQHAMHLRSGNLCLDFISVLIVIISRNMTERKVVILSAVRTPIAENVAREHNVSRDEQDRFALQSQQRTEAAQKAGHFAAELVTVNVPVPRGEPKRVTDDEFPRHGASIEALAKLRPVFDKSGTVTAGNASGINDGAAALVLADEGVATSRSLQPLARIMSSAQAGLDPGLMGMGPVPAVRAALEKAGWKSEDVDLFELNEAFAAQSVAVTRELGARVLVTLVHALRRTGGKKGVAALCIGGGMGIAMCIEAL
ncbi:hypothetical protein B566_EDAN012328 [Ephemera danica]|nr:hypothetical protein B566_EDAN012328 [Ephemera danica]